MHMKASDKDLGPEVVPVKFILEDPEGLTGDQSRGEVELKAAIGESILDVALDNGINIEHACGGVCACSTCHMYVEAGEWTTVAARLPRPKSSTASRKLQVFR